MLFRGKMILSSIRLNNIRSYTDEKIDFPEGSVLLSGDIGSGKTTILLAVEFALFGIMRPMLTGNSLLRHGKKEGSVELRFYLDNREIIIKRNLKRKSGDDIGQESGYIIVDGRKKEGTAVELKNDVLNLLGYPSELLTKSKSLVYRYTVYTPQEEMKQILFEEDEARLDTLRRVFGIDKYKRIRENSEIYIRELKEKRKEIEGFILDLEEKKSQKKEREHDLKEIAIKIDEIKPRIIEIKAELKNKKKDIEKIEQDIKKLNDLKKEFEVCRINILNKASLNERNKAEIKELEKRIEKLEAELKGKKDSNIADVNKKLEELENSIDFMENTAAEIDARINDLKSSIKSSNEIKVKFSKMNECPLCRQKVEHGHKMKILIEEDGKIKGHDERLKLFSEQGEEARKKLDELKKDHKLLIEQKSELNLILLKIRDLEEKTRLKNKLCSECEEIKKDIGGLNVKKSELENEISKFGDAEKEYLRFRKELDAIAGKEREVELENNSLLRDKENILKLMKAIDEEIGRKEKAKEKLAYLRDMQEWLQEGFQNLMNVMEKHVMASVYHEFNELFQNWFNVLIEDEALNVRLDDVFNPVIAQNGYETIIENLSGGEKTSLALAYRLALNKVINDLISQIRTKDLIILDEPTDGFSETQLDKIRDVLDQLNVKQAIIVSHESKIESFVDNVIKIRKEGHESHAD
ncbi:AAA family ATPase [Candidatus Woesearchaeota archaeon]|nr:AAA family ATPase [Candidatus Woesearchaeota archaeon]